MKKINFKAAMMLAISFVSATVLTSCSEQTSIPAETIEKIEYKTVEKSIERIIDNTVIWDGEHILFNGATALTASVAPDSLTLTMPAEQHKASDIKDFLGDNRWTDSNGNAFTGTLVQTSLEGLELTAAIEPAAKFSTLTPIHPKVSMVKGQFNLVGMATLTETGKSESFTLSVQNGTYFLCDTAVTVKEITNTEYQIEYRDTVEYIHIDKDVVIVNGYGFGTIDFAVGNKSFSFRVDLDSTLIHRTESEWGVAKLSDQNAKGFTLSDLQKGKYTIKENGINLKSVSFVGEAASFAKLNDSFKYGTTTIKVVVSEGEDVRDFTVSASYFHELKAGATPSVIVPDVTTDHTYTVDSTRTAVKDSEGNLIGEKMRITVTRDDDKKWKVQFMTWETGLLSPTITGTQVGGNNQLRATTATPEAYNADGWSGTDTSREGFTIVATAKEYKFRTAFPAVPGFGASEESVAESNIVFGTRSCTFQDAETGWGFTVTAGTTDVNITFDQVGTDEAAKAEVNGRGLQYEYIGTHFLTVDQYVSGVKVLTQSRNEQLLYPKN